MYKFIPILGNFEIKKEIITFKGAPHVYKDEKTEKEVIGAKTGLIISDHFYNEGKISLDVTFTTVDDRSGCEIIFNYGPSNNSYFSAGILPSGGMFGIKSTSQNNGQLDIQYLKIDGDHNNLLANKQYHLELVLKGTQLEVYIDSVNVLSHILPYGTRQAQAGILCMGRTDVVVKNFTIESEKPKVFMIMQLEERYNELYEEVVKEVCNNKNYDLNIIKADEIYGPGIIISDIIKYIYESRVIIAEISPLNANVFYEVGYAHALNKPTILIAEKETKLPFDVSPFRVLFYENTIAGKRKVQEGLKKHLNAILNQ